MTTATLAPAFYDHGSVANGATVTPVLSRGSYHRISAAGAGLTVAAPVVSATSRVQGQEVDVADPVRAGAEDAEIGQLLLIEIKNASGGALTVTWNAAFKGAPANPANGQRRFHQFFWDGANWVLTNNAADVPN